MRQKYPDDFPTDFIDEVLLFREFDSGQLLMTTDRDDGNKLVDLYRLIHDSNVSESFPNVETALRMYVCLMITNWRTMIIRTEEG